LGYTYEKVEPHGEPLRYYKVTAPQDRRLIFVGDLVDRGPGSPEVLKLVMSAVRDGVAFTVPGNHDDKLKRKLGGRNVQLKHGLAETMEQLEQESEAFREDVRAFVRGLSAHLEFDGGKLVVAHAGLKESMHGRISGKVRSFCLYGETTGETDEFGLPIRHNWAEEYQGEATVVYGHTPIPKPQWLNRTLNIDTGCVFGGKLTALRYPEKTIEEVEAFEEYCAPTRPLAMNVPEVANQLEHDEVLNYAYFGPKTLAMTRLNYNVTNFEHLANSALENLNRFGVNPKWLIYLPPTMSPPKTSKMGDYLEYPSEAFGYYSKKGLTSVVVEEKHMGSRAVVVICKDEAAAESRFGVKNEGIGVIYTRTGRPFFKDKSLEQALLIRLRDALTKANFWEDFQTEWFCFDCELMPWSVKAVELLKQQYAATGTAAAASAQRTLEMIRKASARGVDMGEMEPFFESRTHLIADFKAAYRQYCWTTDRLDGIKLAPFHILAGEQGVYMDKTHIWHMENIHKFCEADEEILLATNYKVVDLEDPESIQAATAWWEQMTEAGGEGMVVKP
ncbi:MAG: polynucleotide kinase-phosphatase, partial [Bacteroidota bacterium]